MGMAWDDIFLVIFGEFVLHFGPGLFTSLCIMLRWEAFPHNLDMGGKGRGKAVPSSCISNHTIQTP